MRLVRATVMSRPFLQDSSSNKSIAKNARSHAIWLVPSLPLAMLPVALFMLLAQSSSPATATIFNGTPLQNAPLYETLILMPASLAIGIIVLMVLLALCITKRLRWTERRTLIAAVIALADILLPVGVVVGVLLYLKSHPLRIIF